MTKKIILLLISVMLVGCFAVNALLEKQAAQQWEQEWQQKQQNAKRWWHTATADLVVEGVRYYVRQCAIFTVPSAGQAGAGDNSNVDMDQQALISSISASEIFSVSVSAFSSCQPKSTPLVYDGEYIIFNVCEMAFGAGGCGGGRYRSADDINWEEYIGITWIKGEQYEAWRTVGSTSSKADSVKKVVD